MPTKSQLYRAAFRNYRRSSHWKTARRYKLWPKYRTQFVRGYYRYRRNRNIKYM